MTNRLFVIGSCRIWRPLRPFHKDGTIEITNMRDPWWFTHTPRGAVQMIEVALGKRQIPAHLHNLIVETSPRKRTVDFDGRQAIAAADQIIVEISSLKSYDCEGFELNLHRMREAQIDVPMNRVTFEDLIRALNMIEDLTGKPISLVDHIPFAPSGELIIGRRQISDYLARSGRQFVSKADFLKPEWLKDSSHHLQTFEKTIGGYILSALSSDVRRDLERCEDSK